MKIFNTRLLYKLFFVSILLITNSTLARYIVRPQDRAVFHNNQGAQMLSEEKIDQAIFELKTAIEISPEYVEALNNLGLAYKMKGRYQEAIETLEKALKFDKEYSGAWTSLGTVYNNIGQHSKAIDCFKKAIDHNKKYAEAYYNMGVSYRLMAEKGSNTWEKAIENFKKATEANPNHYWSSVELGQIYMARGNDEDALIRFKVAVETNPNSAEGWMGLSELYRKLGNPAKAEEALNNAKQLQPTTKVSENPLQKSQQFLKDGNLTLAEKELEKAIAQDPNQSGLAMVAGMIRFARGNALLSSGKTPDAEKFFREALNQFQKALSSQPGNADILYNIAYTYYRLGDLQNAKNHFEKVLDKQPKHYSTLFALGLLEGQMGEEALAKKHLCRFIQEAPSSFQSDKDKAMQIIGSCSN